LHKLFLNSVRARIGFVVTLAAIALLALVAPAAAQGSTSSAVLAAEQFKWFYWIGFILAASLAAWLIGTAVLYYVRVIRPKHRGREVS
jgi:biotin transporter BioY